MSAATTVPDASPATTRANGLGRVSLTAGVLAAALTMLLSFAALALSVVAVTTGAVALVRGGGRAPAAGAALGAATLYLVLLEVFLLGG